MRFSNQYLTYIRSSAWTRRRQRALARAGNRCQVCGRSYWLQVHHRDYKNLGHEQDQDLTVLCWECHTLYTWYSRIKRFFAWIWKGLKWIFFSKALITIRKRVAFWIWENLAGGKAPFYESRKLDWFQTFTEPKGRFSRWLWNLAVKYLVSTGDLTHTPTLKEKF